METSPGMQAAISHLDEADYEKLCDEARRIFPENSLQHLDCESAKRCQALLGHGDRLGVWETPGVLMGRREAAHLGLRKIDLRKRLCDYLPEDIQPSPTLDALLDEGVLWMTRYALLLRLGPVGMRSIGHSIDVSTIAHRVYQHVPKILAKGIQRRLDVAGGNATGFVRWLTSDDLNELQGVELKRLSMAADQGLWSDSPSKASVEHTTSPKGDAVIPAAQSKHTPFPPIPDDYLAEMGPRVLWLVQDLGPNLLHLFESLPGLFGDIQFGKGQKKSATLKRRLSRYFDENVWRDGAGQVIAAPPFRFKIGSNRGAHMTTEELKADHHEWPPRTWDHVNALATSLQAGHLWIALLAMAGRISEVSSLKRDCVEWARDGQPYANGKTYKLSRNLAGTERDWPAPQVLVQALAQQKMLVVAWEQIARVVKGANEKGGETLVPSGEHLWASLGSGSSSDPEEELATFGKALKTLSMRLGLAPKPGGKALHPHRFRKTIARLAGIAIVDSPRVLMKLLGHKDIAMTMHYILTDKALQVEIDQVAREMRIMRCQELIDDIHSALHTEGSPKHGGHGGGGAAALTEAVMAREEELHRTGRQWDAESSYELSVILTGNGQYFRVTRPGVLCMKESREAGPCTCDSTCVNRIEDKTIRRDTREVIPILIEEGKRALAENQLLLVADKIQQIDEDLARFADINTEFCDHPDLIVLREAVA